LPSKITLETKYFYKQQLHALVDCRTNSN